MARALIVTGMLLGDEGKGTLVDALCRRCRAAYVIRYGGGFQCAHNVVLPNGQHHTFSQWGSGSFSGVPTWLWRDVIIEPFAMLAEADHLESLWVKPWEMLLVHPDCPVATLVHRQANRECKQTLQHGTCGLGVGECRQMSRSHPKATIHAKDLSDLDLVEHKLGLQHDLLHERVNQKLMSRSMLPSIAQEMHEAAQHLCLANRIQPRPDETIILEGAQGILLDENFGFHPHTTWSDVTLRNAKTVCRELNIRDTYTLGVTRCYATRHGPGPLPTEQTGWSKRFLSDHNKIGPEGYQGKLRAGPLDMQLLNYAARAAGGKLDGIAVTWLDEYPGIIRRDYQPLPLPECLSDQEKLCQQLFESTGKSLYAEANRIELWRQIELATGSKVVASSVGPTYLGKSFLKEVPA